MSQRGLTDHPLQPLDYLELYLIDIPMGTPNVSKAKGWKTTLGGYRDR
jgi:hypothetical protein